MDTWRIILSILLMVCGVFSFFKPGALWHLTEGWKSYSASDPSDLYLKIVKIGGIFLVIVGIALLAFPAFYEAWIGS